MRDNFYIIKISTILASTCHWGFLDARPKLFGMPFGLSLFVEKINFLQLIVICDRRGGRGEAGGAGSRRAGHTKTSRNQILSALIYLATSPLRNITTECPS